MSGDWTIQRLNETSPIDFAIAVLNERRNKLTNSYSPLSMKIGYSIKTLEKLKKDFETMKGLRTTDPEFSKLVSELESFINNILVV